MAFCWLKQRQSQFVCLTVGSLAEALHHQLSKGAADPCRIGDHDTSVGHRIASLGLTEGLTHLFFDSGDIPQNIDLIFFQGFQRFNAKTFKQIGIVMVANGNCAYCNVCTDIVQQHFLGGNRLFQGAVFIL